MVTGYDNDDVDFQIAAEPEAALLLNRELNVARRIVEQTGVNLFLTGKAGTGKTTFLRHLRETSKKRMVVLAPTGVAAINAHGMTIHSFFQLPFAPFVPGRGFVGQPLRLSFGKEKRKLLASLDLIVIDEVSMVRPDTLDAIDYVMRRYRNPGAAFGGVQLLLIGDVRQLAPVVKEADKAYLREHYASPYFFESKALCEAGFQTVELRNVYRQNDMAFIDLLNAVRNGAAGDAVLDALNARYIPAEKRDGSWRNVIKLTTHNSIADGVNSRRLKEINAAPLTFTAEVEGKFPESSFPAEHDLTLKVGARVMFIRNDAGVERRYYNGMLGTVVEMSAEGVTVRPDVGYEDIFIGPVIWENEQYDVDVETKEVKQTVVGRFSQVPLRLAWAITIHKSQGLTFERVIIDASQSFAPGQLYVALSRCRSLEGLMLDSRLTSSSVITDSAVNGFIASPARKTPGEQELRNMRSDFFRSTLADLFSFASLCVRFTNLSRAVREYVTPIHAEFETRYKKAEQIISNELQNVAANFFRLFAAVREDDPVLSDKIMKGCGYFSTRLRAIVALVEETPMLLENKNYTKRLLNASEAFLFEAKVRQQLLEHFEKHPFVPSHYIYAKGRATIETADMPVTERLKRKRHEHQKKEKRAKGYSARESLKMAQSGMSVEAIAAQRELTSATVAKHLVPFIISGEIDVVQLLSAEHVDWFDGWYEGLRGHSRKVMTEAWPRQKPVYYLDLLLADRIKRNFAEPKA